MPCLLFRFHFTKYMSSPSSCFGIFVNDCGRCLCCLIKCCILAHKNCLLDTLFISTSELVNNGITCGASLCYGACCCVFCSVDFILLCVHIKSNKMISFALFQYKCSYEFHPSGVEKSIFSKAFIGSICIKRTKTADREAVPHQLGCNIFHDTKTGVFAK